MKNDVNRKAIAELARDPGVREDTHQVAVRVQHGAQAKAPVETGDLVRSIEVDEHGDGWRVEAKVHYAWYVEKGHRTESGTYVPGEYFMQAGVDAARD